MKNGCLIILMLGLCLQAHAQQKHSDRVQIAFTGTTLDVAFRF